MFRRSTIVATALSHALLTTACDDRDRSLDDVDVAVLEEMELSEGAIPSSPTNRFADDLAAAALGRRLFFDRALSENGTVACSDCHDPALGFVDARRRSLGTDGLPGGRYSMPVHSVALLSFFLWDGRASAAWRQPLFALENELEMNTSRTAVAHVIAERYAADYEAVFGALPDLSAAPASGKPGDASWDALSEGERDAIQRVAVNVGKALEAYERRLVCADTRFDRWQRGELELDQDELDGAASFVAAGCPGCHSGPAFSDGGFHDLGLAAPGDQGRAAGLDVLLDDPLGAASPYSDDPAAGQSLLLTATSERRVEGAFRTASLRGVGQRPRFGHLGDHTQLESFIEDTYQRRGRGRGRGGDGDDGDGDADPLLQAVDLEGGDAERIEVFLRTLDCPDVSEAWLAP